MARQGHLSDDLPLGFPLRWPCWATETKKIWRESPSYPLRLLSRPKTGNCACVCAGYEHATLSFSALATYHAWGLSGHSYSVTISMAHGNCLCISADALHALARGELRAHIAKQGDKKKICCGERVDRHDGSSCRPAIPNAMARFLTSRTKP